MSRTLREIREDINLALEPNEDGEIDFEKLELLGMEETQKKENIALYLLQLRADEEALTNEIGRLQDRRDSVRKQSERIRDYLKYALNGENFKTPLVHCFSTSTSFVRIDENATIPDQYVTKKEVITPNKKAIKEAIKNGEEFEGIGIEKREVLIVR